MRRHPSATCTTALRPAFAGVVGAALVATACGTGPVDRPATRESFTTADDPLDETALQTLLDEFQVPGVSLAVFEDFDVVRTAAVGVRDMTTGTPVDERTLFQAASISKPVAAMTALAAVDEGRVNLDADVNGMLTSWQVPATDHLAARPVTLRGLLSHTSGTGDGFGFPGYAPGEARPALAEILDGATPSNVGPVRIVRPPLTAFHYSGGGYTIVQLAVEDALGGPFAQIARDRVLDPIGMTASTFAQPLPDDRDANAARAHGRDGRPMGPKWRVYPELAAAGLWTTPTDLAWFAIDVQSALRGDAGRVLRPATARLMTDPVGVGDFGLGFEVLKRGEGWYFEHGGSNWGFQARLVAHKLKGYGAVIMTNGDNGGALILELLARLARAYRWDVVDEPVPR